jgi:hypothetical protein
LSSSGASFSPFPSGCYLQKIKERNAANCHSKLCAIASSGDFWPYMGFLFRGIWAINKGKSEVFVLVEERLSVSG